MRLPGPGDLDGRGNLSEQALCDWMGYVLGHCLDQVRFMAALLGLESMKDRIAACLSSLDALITAATQELDTLKTHKKGLMQQLFPSAGEGAA